MPLVPKATLLDPLVAFFLVLVADDQDSVRLLAVDLCAAVAAALSPAEAAAVVMPHFRKVRRVG